MHIKRIIRICVKSFFEILSQLQHYPRLFLEVFARQAFFLVFLIIFFQVRSTPAPALDCSVRYREQVKLRYTIYIFIFLFFILLSSRFLVFSSFCKCSLQSLSQLGEPAHPLAGHKSGELKIDRTFKFTQSPTQGVRLQHC